MTQNSSGGGSNDPGKRYEAFGAYYFRVDLHQPGSGVVMGSFPFRSCSGLKSEASVVELEEGGFNGTTRKLIGRTKFPNIVLKQGLCTPNSALWKLRLSYMNDGAGQPLGDKKGRVTPNRISGTITQLGPNGAEAKWLFVSGWVCKWEGPDLDATKNEVSIETIEIAHEGLMMLAGTEAK
jgi:phage tail-like protein